LDFQLTEEQLHLKKSIREFAEREILPNVMKWDEPGQFPLDVVKELGRMGVMGMIFPTDFGGAGLGAAIYAGVLLITAYCAGIQWLGMDWLASGALQPLAGAGEWWRAVAALTLHMDQAHLLGNLLFGLGIGILAARVFGPGLAWASILGAGATGNYLEMLIAPSTHRAVGASTAVFAALGLLAGFSWRQRLNLRERFRYRWAPLFAGVCLLGFLGAGGEHVDVLGHVLGFATGIALGWTYARARVPRSRGYALQLGAGGASLGLIVAAWILALRHGVPAP